LSEAEKKILKKAISFYPVKPQIIAFRSTHKNIDIYTFIKKLGQLNQIDKQVVRDNIQQNLFVGKFCSFLSVLTILEKFIEGSIKMKIHGINFLFYP